MRSHRIQWVAQSLAGSLEGLLAGHWAAGAGPQSAPLSAGSPALQLLRRANRGQAATVTTSKACYQQRGDGAWVAVAPQYCAPAAAAPVAVAPPPPPRVVRDELGDRMLLLREGCEDGDRRACVRLGILIGENRERRAAWRREHPEVFFYER
jgi:hypothetical protein